MEIRVICEAAGEALRDLALLARRFGLDVEGVKIDRAAGGSVVATACGDSIRAKRGRRRRDRS